MPKGDLTRDQLSSLLLIYLGTASDIVDFFTVMSEKQIVEDKSFVYCILFIWSWSLFQFPFTVTATKDNEEEEEEENQLDQKKETKREKCMKYVEIFLESEAWGIMISVLMQDGPFVIIRLIAIFKYKVFTYTNCFFACKNALVLALQLYRLISLYCEKKENKKKKGESKAKLGYNFCD